MITLEKTRTPKKTNNENRTFEFEMISDNMVNIISEYAPKIKIAKKYKNLTVF